MQKRPNGGEKSAVVRPKGIGGGVYDMQTFPSGECREFNAEALQRDGFPVVLETNFTAAVYYLKRR